MNRGAGQILSFVLLALSGFIGYPRSAKALLIVQPGEQNVTLINDRAATQSLPGVLSPRLIAGDFNGDGYKDLAIAMELPSPTRMGVDLFLGPFGKEAIFSSRSNMHVEFSRDGVVGVLPRLLMADIDKDGKDDLVIARPRASSTRGRIEILFGESPVKKDVNLDTEEPGLRIVGKPGTYVGWDMGAGDFNGDGVKDLVLGTANVGNEVYLLFGSTTRVTGAMDLSVENPLPRIIKTGIGRDVMGYIVTGDFNRDGKDDLALSNSEADTGEGLRSGEINVVFGTTTFPSAWTLGSPPANVQVWGNAGGTLRAYQAAGDLTGDGRDELAIQTGHVSLGVLDGSDLDSGLSIRTLSPGSVNPVAYHRVGSLPDSGKIRFLDFDRDGSDDLFILDDTSEVTAFLTSDFPPGGNISTQSPSLQLNILFQEMTSGDFNGDGVQDVVGYEDFDYDNFSPYGAIRIIYGFRPFKDPTVRILPRPVASPRATVELSVAGDPTEMNLSGNIVDSFQGQWIPFQSRRDVVFTANESSKTVTARFRNGVGRESELAQASTVVTVGSSGIVIGTNRLRQGGTVVFDCHVEVTGTVRARIFDAEGEEVRELMYRDVERGVYPVTWDGSNASGRRVGRGFYYMVLEVNGEPITKKILVE